MKPPLIVIGGPTASGKSGLAIELAAAVGGVVINADSMQVYRDLAIMTARPRPADMARAPHRLYGVLDAADVCSAARWAELARGEIAAAGAADRLPIVVGGTGLYLKTLLGGIAAVPEIPQALRQAARDRHAAVGGPAFHAELAGLDPAAAARLAPGDSQRLIRAYEVVTSTGRPLHAWQADGNESGPEYHTARIILAPPRDTLYAACDHRFEAMLADGALDEVRALDARGLDPDLPLMKAVGVPELRRHLAGELDLPAAMALAQQATRRYAKRQGTWFRHQIQSPEVLITQLSETMTGEICSFLHEMGLTKRN
ncbi:MAG TPA: tRNA (adenosine(37)-N6)-dimethylallyltransferase MiaA [Stellaceae bacterium]|nr:tRNA (adenosine(37)-N6)-dimethylallyltransferase MiaA [Stellaceae bacterium]